MTTQYVIDHTNHASSLALFKKALWGVESDVVGLTRRHDIHMRIWQVKKWNKYMPLSRPELAWEHRWRWEEIQDKLKVSKNNRQILADVITSLEQEDFVSLLLHMDTFVLAKKIADGYSLLC